MTEHHDALLPFATPQTRRDFYERVSDLDARMDPDRYLERLAQEWRHLGGATWAGIWLWNRLNTRFELVSVGRRPGWDKSFEDLPEPGDQSISDLACKLKRPVFWNLDGPALPDQEAEGSGDYTVHCEDFLRELGTTSFSLTPLGLRTGADQPTEALPAGVLSLHYDKAITRPCQEDCASLMTLAKFAWTNIERMRLSNQNRIAQALNALTEQHLTRFGERASEVRKDYLKALVDGLKEWLGISGVSIFWRDQLGEEELICLWTTGVKSLDGEFVHQPSDFPKVAYPKGASRTWRVFDSGDPYIVDKDNAGEEPGLFVEVESSQGSLRGPVLLWPIRSSVGVQNGGVSGADRATGEVLGVIRCAYPKAPPFCEKAERYFNEGQIQTLRQILNHISPVLHTFERRGVQEAHTSVVRHDLLAPLGNIRDSADFLMNKADISAWPEGHIYYLANLRERATRLAVLADQLKIDLVIRPDECRPAKTLVGSSIVAPMKRMMYHFAKETNDIEIVYSGFDSLPPLMIDRALIERAIYNLLVNAIKYGERGTKVEVVGRVVDDGCAIDVINRGEGVEERDTGLIFAVGYRSRRARDMAQGTGLGLAIVSQIMKAHQGKVQLFHRKDPTVFRLLFPKSRIVG